MLQGQGLTPTFNELAFYDRWMLKGAAFTKTVASVFREDVDLRPWRYLLYIAPLAVLTGTPGGWVIGIPAFLALIKTAKWHGFSWGREMHDRLDAAWDEKNIVTNHEGFIFESGPGFSVRKIALSAEAGKASLQDISLATGTAWRALKKTLTGGPSCT